MKKTIAVLAFLAFATVPFFGEQLTGYVSDAQCASKGSKAAKATDWINPAVFPSCVE
jgi:hypothetical protein